ncbi:MAG: hypothetical protein WC621_00905 [Patescibacteria group bacterium]
MLLDIVILPPVKLRERIGKAVLNATQGVAYRYVIDNKKLIPHVSLFHIKTSKTRLSKLSQIVEEITHQQKSFVIKSERIKPDSTLSLRLSNSQAFKKMHRNMVLKCYHLRTGEMPWTPIDLPTKLEKYFRKKYGTQHVLRLKEPHFTLVCLKNKTDVQIVAKRLSNMRVKFIVKEVAICEVNFWHQVTRILKRFKI